MSLFKFGCLMSKHSFILKCQSSLRKGFTIVELMVGVALLAIITTIALPNLSDFTVQMRVDNEITEMHRLLLTARNAAINSGIPATVCPLAGNVCSGANNWQGSIGVISVDGLIKEKGAIKASDRLQYNNISVVFTPSGRLGNTIGTFRYCPTDHLNHSRGIDVSLSGRVYISTDIDADGKDEIRNGTEIVCI